MRSGPGCHEAAFGVALFDQGVRGPWFAPALLTVDPCRERLQGLATDGREVELELRRRAAEKHIAQRSGRAEK